MMKEKKISGEELPKRNEDDKQEEDEGLRLNSYALSSRPRPALI